MGKESKKNNILH